jgi:hypothetical protein
VDSPVRAGMPQPTAPAAVVDPAALPASSEPSLADVLAQVSAQGGDPRLLVDLQETFSCLSIRKQRTLLRFVATGNLAAAGRAGHDVTTTQSAYEVARRDFTDPRMQYCLRAIQQAEHGNGTALATILAHHLAGFQGSEGDKNRSAKVGLAIYRQTRPMPVPGTKPLADQLLDEMSERELETFITEKRWPERFRDRLAPSRCAAMDVRHHHGRDEPQHPPDDVNSHARHHEPRASSEPLDPTDVAPPRSALPSAGASSSVTRDYIGATAPVFGDDRVYDPQAAASPTPTAAINAPLLESYATAQREIALGEARLREAREPDVPPALRDVALRDRRW